MADGPKTRVLVVDDAHLVRMYFRQALESAGYEVDEALNGLEALEKILVLVPDLLVVDVNMPRMDGMTFLRALRQMEGPVSTIPALVTTTESGPQDIVAARAAGANFFLTKPVAQDVLVEFAGLLCGLPA